MTVPFLATKLYIPPPRPTLVSRPRLLAKLDSSLQPGCKLLLVSAPAGFGKTTLVSEWVQHCGLKVAWLSVDEEDNEPLRFFQGVAAALETIQPEMIEDFRKMLQAPILPALELLVAQLINDLAQAPEQFLLILDDYHQIQNKALHDNLNYFIQHIPTNAHLAILTRADPPLQLSRLRGRGELCEVRAAMLRFVTQETAQFLNQAMKLDLAVEQIGTLENRTEGWITGLQMAAISLQGRSDKDDFISAFAGDDRYITDYLMEEVLQSQSSQVQEFLLVTSVLDRFNAAVCAALTGRTDSQQLLTELENANLFVIPLDNRREWFRYHHLFGLMLNKYLAQARGAEFIQELQQKASLWHASQGSYGEAVKYALQAKDYPAAAHLVVLAAPRMFELSELNTLRRWSEMLPDVYIGADLRLCIIFGWANLATNHLAETAHFVHKLEEAAGTAVSEIVQQPKRQEQLSPRALAILIEVATMRARLAVDQFDIAEALAIANWALPFMLAEPGTVPMIYHRPVDLRSPMLFTQALSYMLSGDLSRAYAGFEECLVLGKELNNIHIVALSTGYIGQILTIQGQWSQAESIYQKALESSQTEFGRASAFFGMALVGLGQIAYERNQLDSAGIWLQEGIAQGKIWNSWEVYLPGYLVQARLQAAQNDFAAAHRILDQALEDCRDHLILANPVIESLRAMLFIRQGKLENVAHWLEESGIHLGVDPSQPYEEAFIVLAEYLLATDQVGQAITWIDRLLAQAQQHQRWSRVIYLLCLRATARQAAGEIQAAVSDMQQALELGEPEGAIRTLADAGPQVIPLLQGCLRAGGNPQYLTRILEACSTGRPRETGSARLPGQSNFSQNEALPEPLSEREIAVLKLAATGVSNAEIAQHFYISVNTVKKHISNIFGKLGVTSRIEAVERARQLGIIE